MIRTTRLGEQLVAAGRLTQTQLDDCLVQLAKEGGRLSTLLTEKGYISEDDLVQFLSERFGVRAVRVAGHQVPEELVKLVPAELARRHGMLPISKVGATLNVAMADPSNVLALDDVKFRTGYTVVAAVAAESELRTAIDENYSSEQSLRLQKAMADLDAPETDTEGALQIVEEAGEEEIDLDALAQESSQAPVIRLVNLMLIDAIRRGASDIHLEPYETEYRVRFRVDGVLYEVMSPPLARREAITSRLKIMAHLDIAEKRLPQDGRIKMRTRIDGKVKDLDFRVSVMPTIYGEKIVLRLLDKDQLRLDMGALGLEPSSLARLEEAILRPYGMVLVTGPTGSGKTNTLYSALSRLNQPGVNIMTAEDPVEFNLNGINQVQTKEQIGLDFATALRSFLRQDPNIILVGEIRDLETAEVAIKAAMTGHLVLSTLHTNDAASSVTRLINMGIEPFLVATSVHFVAAQRLVRRICSHCQEPVQVPHHVLVDLGFSPDEAAGMRLTEGRGCERCVKTGYKGRIALFEAMPIEARLRQLILDGASASELRKQAIADGMLTLRRSGIEKLRAGVTTVEEVLRETVA